MTCTSIDTRDYCRSQSLQDLAVHTVPGGDLAGSPRIPPQLPDNGRRADGYGSLYRLGIRLLLISLRSPDDECLSSGRIDGCCRGSDNGMQNDQEIQGERGDIGRVKHGKIGEIMDFVIETYLQKLFREQER